MKLLAGVRAALRMRHYSSRTEEAYADWIRRFIHFHGRRHPAALGNAEVSAFLSHLAVERRVSASTQNQALSALLFLYGEVLRRPVGWMAGLVRAKVPQHTPVVLTRDEARAIIGQMSGSAALVCRLLYGSGLRLLEALQLRVQDVEFARGEIHVRGGKGGRDRVTMLPVVLQGSLRSQLEGVRAQHRRDLAAGAGWVELPFALGRKYPRAGREWGWQWVFPGTRIHADRESAEQRRYHLHETGVQRAFSRSGSTERGGQGGSLSHAAPLLRDRATAVRLRHPDRPGAPGPS